MTRTAGARLARAGAIGGAVLAAGAGLAAAVLLVRGDRDAAPSSSTVPTVSSTGTVTGGVITAAPTLRSEIDRVLDGLSLGNVAFNAPKTLRANESAVIQLLLSGEQPIDQLQEQLTELGEKEGEQIKVSDRMEARLSGLGFKIEAITPGVQLVSGEGITEWRWEIEPTKVGRRRLHLSLSALIDLRGSESTYTVRTFERSLDVRVTWSERLSGFFSDNWKWLWTTLLIPLAGWALGRRKRTGPQSSDAAKPS
jgi:hypothetical protein